MKTRPYRTSSRTGFTVFEVMLALALFSLVMVGLAVALEKTIDVSILNRRESLVRQGLESRLALARQRPLQVGLQKMEPDDLGVSYESEVKPLELKNQRNVSLSSLYQLTIRAQWKENGADEIRQASLYVYQP